MKRKPSPYKGKLARSNRPRLARASIAFGNSVLEARERSEQDRENAKHVAALIEYEMRGIDLLCKHYAITNHEDPTAKFLMLAVCLARDHVPYFHAPRKKTGPKVGMTGAFLEIDLAIELLSGAKNESEAFVRLCEKPLRKGNDPDSLARKQRGLRNTDGLTAAIRKISTVRTARSNQEQILTLKSLRKILSDT